MTIRPVLALMPALLGMAAGWAVSVAAQPASIPGVANPERARQNYILKCQGCHRPDGGGSFATAPAMKGVLGQFLSIEGGRDYLARVPGVSTAAIPDAELAELLNWTIWKFDSAHVPSDFRPYTGEEMGRLRRNPLRTNAPAIRAGLVTRLEASQHQAK